MANRKVLINRHTSGSSAPQADSMYLGEIAVAHETGKETIWTKNNDGIMVPFISCAQTIAIIDSKIAGSEDSVVAKEGESHIEVESAGTTAATIWRISSKDVQSESEFKTYSAATKVRIDTNASAITETLGIISALTDFVVTGISGDEIISAVTVNPSTGANDVKLYHRTGLTIDGFNKLSTDGYGHVTASTAVAASDIEALGFKDSAWTEEAITNAINELDSAISASTTGKYLTAISIKDGMLDKMEEADIPVLEIESAGTGNVVASITVSDHKITYETASVATSEGIAELSAATQAISGYAHDEIAQLSGATEAISGYAHDEIAALSAGTIQLSADTKATIEQLSAGTIMVSGYAHSEIVELSGAVQANENNIDELSGATVAEFNSAFTAIQAMDKSASAEDGKVVTTVSEVDGVVSETKANVKDLQLGGYEKDTTATGDITSTDTINAALSKLENKAAAITIANADKSINVTTGATGTDINVNIKSGEKVLAKDGNAGLYTDLDLVKITTGLPAEIKERYQLLATDDSQIGVNIDVPKDSHIVSINYITTGEHAQNLEYVYIDASGVTQTTYVDMSELVLEAEFASGVTVTDHIAHGVVDPTSETFLTVGGNGFKLSGVQDAIDAKVNALDVTGDTAVAGQYVAAIEQTDGLVAVKTRANVSEAVLTNYAKGSDATAVAATDTVNQAISKLENQVDAAKAAATTKVVEGTDAGNNMTITPTTSATDGSVTYTVDLTDVASKTALDAEIAARKAVDGQNGDTYAANAGTNFISDATSLNDADVKLDAAIKAEENARIAAIEALDSVGSASTTGHYLTSVTITDGKITAVGEVAVPANVAITATTDAAVNTPSAVLTGVTADGTDNHNLTFGMSNKVFSASSSDSAVTSQSAITSLSAQTSVSANMAYELSSAATITSGQVTNFVEGVQNIKVNSASTAESADTAAKVANALSISGYATSESSSLDSAVNYDGSAAQSITFGKNTAAGKSMSFNSGIVDVEIIDCGEY